MKSWVACSIASLIVLAVLVSGCAETPQIEKPTVTVDSVSVKNVAPRALDLEVRVIVSNPNSIGAHLTKVVFDIYYLKNGEQKYLGHGELRDVDIRSQGDTTITVPITVDNSRAIAGLRELAKSGAVKIKVSGSAYLDLKATTLEIPFEKTKEVSLALTAPEQSPTTAATSPTATTTATPTPTPTGSIYVSSSPSGASIYIDGIYQGTTPKTISNLNAGMYTLRLSKDGYEEHTERVIVEAGRTATVSVSLSPIPTPTPTTTTTPTPTETATPTPTPAETTREKLFLQVSPSPAKVGQTVEITVSVDGEPVPDAYVGYVDVVNLTVGLTAAYLTESPEVAVSAIKSSGKIAGTTDANGKIEITFDKRGEYIIATWKPPETWRRPIIEYVPSATALTVRRL
ncbi:PEGA domain-containing protein [Methermicoccus shengliensis]|uniref:PEGA domain-containing protein n=1 Tax=Methermicoccus shengliensis TaxID=660064 RepID=A0A832RXJ6_9EURY|nr:PEGA domain-containing protein [Methermicoccus shengliensis]KUK04736.1 MAG: Water Stress and Hypersensitive response domain-containing protein [Euryarchaeota archaeon 55_53]KUK29818.1 MAG: Water Stress and Hypersensitive response domain-containing protein [Methanosarcinales archeaon 56_1174]MDI3487404.1 hypothetical protein [Methanosarcinales archaeon]MDN5295267.1 hypothetical protein [Methanosarcinales archaeon]HIH69644.1 PEGA domain-containing protein [Methermicoccus shengliensis]